MKTQMINICIVIVCASVFGIICISEAIQAHYPYQNDIVENSQSIFTYTGDNTPPNQVFVKGITPKKNIKTLYEKTLEYKNSKGYYVKTFLTPEMASEQGKYVYIINNRNGIDQKNKKEISISGRVLPGDIKAVMFKNYSLLLNPNYLP